MGRAPKRDAVNQETLAIEKRRLQAEELYLRGSTQAEIARVLDVSQKTVSRDLEECRKQWQESMLVQMSTAKAETLRKWDRLERTAWDAFQKSKTITRRTEDRDPKTDVVLAVRVTTETSAGEKGFLQQVGLALAERCEILGLYAPKIKVWRDDELRRKLASALAIKPEDVPA